MRIVDKEIQAMAEGGVAVIFCSLSFVRKPPRLKGNMLRCNIGQCRKSISKNGIVILIE
ncbi:MAG: hypothetical protein ABI528_02310 [bacterium]